MVAIESFFAVIFSTFSAIFTIIIHCIYTHLIYEHLLDLWEVFCVYIPSFKSSFKFIWK